MASIKYALSSKTHCHLGTWASFKTDAKNNVGDDLTVGKLKKQLTSSIDMRANVVKDPGIRPN